MPHVGWLNISVARFSSPGSNEVDPICNRATCISSLVSIHFYSVLNELNTYLYLSIVLIMVQ